MRKEQIPASRWSSCRRGCPSISPPRWRVPEQGRVAARRGRLRAVGAGSWPAPRRARAMTRPHFSTGHLLDAATRRTSKDYQRRKHPPPQPQTARLRRRERAWRSHGALIWRGSRFASSWIRVTQSTATARRSPCARAQRRRHRASGDAALVRGRFREHPGEDQRERFRARRRPACRRHPGGGDVAIDEACCAIRVGQAVFRRAAWEHAENAAFANLVDQQKEQLPAVANSNAKLAKDMQATAAVLAAMIW